MARLSGLGRGLDALIPSDETDPEGESAGILRELSVDSVSPNPHQPRVHFEEESLTDLAASIREVGVLQPILVRPLGGGAYELIAGERRWRAAQLAGKTTVPAIIRTTDDLASVEQALIENLHRQDLTALEEAAAYQQLIEDFGLTHDSVAKRVGKSRATVSNTLRLMQLPPGIQHLLADGRISAGHARALLGTTDRAFQEHIARRAVEEHWSVRAVEDAVRDRERGERRARSGRCRCQSVDRSHGRGRTAPARPIGARGAARRPPRDAGRGRPDRQAGSDHDRFRRSRGPGADLPANDRTLDVNMRQS